MALLDLTVESSIEELQAIANQVDGVAEQQGWSQKTVFALQVALDEWISNVIKYSYKERSDQPIRVVVNENEDELIASVEDLGTPFDPSSSAVPTAIRRPRASASMFVSVFAASSRDRARASSLVVALAGASR